MSLWTYWKSLTPRTRLLVGSGMIVYAASMQYLSDVAERKLDLVPTEDDMKRLDEAIPKIRVVERREGPGAER